MSCFLRQRPLKRSRLCRSKTVLFESLGRRKVAIVRLWRAACAPWSQHVSIGLLGAGGTAAGTCGHWNPASVGTSGGTGGVGGSKLNMSPKGVRQPTLSPGRCMVRVATAPAANSHASQLQSSGGRPAACSTGSVAVWSARARATSCAQRVHACSTCTRRNLSRYRSRSCESKVVARATQCRLQRPFLPRVEVCVRCGTSQALGTITGSAVLLPDAPVIRLRRPLGALRGSCTLAAGLQCTAPTCHPVTHAGTAGARRGGIGAQGRAAVTLKGHAAVLCLSQRCAR